MTTTTEQHESLDLTLPSFCACGRRWPDCDGSRRGCETTVARRLRTLAAAVHARGLRWALLVPTEPGDAEWVVRLGRVEVVAETLERALEVAVEVATATPHDEVDGSAKQMNTGDAGASH